MSKKKMAEATMEMWDGPFFTSQVDSLNDLWGKDGSPNWAQIEAWVRREFQKEFDSMIRPTTTDGYTWYVAIGLVVEHFEILIALPWGQDWEVSDESKADRSIAVYCNAECAETVLQPFLDGFAEKFTKLVQELPQK